MSFAAIPRELRAVKGWLLWRLIQKDGEPRPRKVPVYANGKWRAGAHGSVKDRAHLVTFDEALLAYEAGGGFYAGLGLAMLPEWGFVALDFDACVDGGVVDPDVEALVAGTYAELSPSGRGVRAFMTGGEDFTNRKSSAKGEAFGFEVFRSKGFVTVTGQELPCSEFLASGLIPVSDAVRALYVERFGEIRTELAGDMAGPTEGRAPSEDGGRLRALLGYVDPDAGYDDWLRAGMACHHESGGGEPGFAAWDEWSARGAKYPGPDAVRAKWESFGRQGGAPVTVGFLEGLARENPAYVADDFAVIEAGGQNAHNAHNAHNTYLAEPKPGYIRNNSGEVLATLNNVILALARPDVCGVRIALDTFRDELMFQPAGSEMAWEPLLDIHETRIQAHLERREGFRPIRLEHLRRALSLVASENQFDSARVWLESLPEWDGVPRVDTFAARYFGAEDNEYTRAVSCYLWTALAGRILSPGCQADMVPVLQGLEGLAKSKAVAAIVPSPDFFTETTLDIKDADQARIIKGVLVAEIGELRGLYTRDRESILAFITRKHEKWVPKYVEKAARYPRRTIFIGTTNDQRFLKKQGQNRRWLPMAITRADDAAIARDRGQLWAEGRLRYELVGMAWQDAERLGPRGRMSFIDCHVWEPAIHDYLYARKDLDGMTPAQRGFVILSDLMNDALNLGAESQQRNAKQVSVILSEMGWEAGRETVDGKQVRRWVPAA